ncbi:unnamed protein product [Amaranthus hypochondriacus]
MAVKLLLLLLIIAIMGPTNGSAINEQQDEGMMIIPALPLSNIILGRASAGPLKCRAIGLSCSDQECCPGGRCVWHLSSVGPYDICEPCPIEGQKCSMFNKCCKGFSCDSIIAGKCKPKA